MYPASQTETDSTFWLRGDGTMMQRRQGRRSVQHRPLELLEQPHMEHIVNASSGRQGEADRDVVDQLGDAVWPEEVRLELAGDSLGE